MSYDSSRVDRMVKKEEDEMLTMIRPLLRTLPPDMIVVMLESLIVSLDEYKKVLTR